jgi:hypothetical protein
VLHCEVGTAVEAAQVVDAQSEETTPVAPVAAGAHHSNWYKQHLEDPCARSVAAVALPALWTFAAQPRVAVAAVPRVDDLPAKLYTRPHLVQEAAAAVVVAVQPATPHRCLVQAWSFDVVVLLASERLRKSCKLLVQRWKG